MVKEVCFAFFECKRLCMGDPVDDALDELDEFDELDELDEFAFNCSTLASMALKSDAACTPPAARSAAATVENSLCSEAVTDETFD